VVTAAAGLPGEIANSALAASAATSTAVHTTAAAL
jgi:hypothetical protein